MSRAQLRRKHMQSGFATVRDICLFFGGMAGVGHETLIASAERPFLLVVFTAMMGLPAVLPHRGGSAPAELPAAEPAPENPPNEGGTA